MEKSKILIVDDEQKIREVIRIYLEKEGFLVGESSDGQEALKMFSRKKWDLILLDLMLPKLDGWAVCREIRKTSSTPIIMLTARDAEMDRILGLELGADDFVVKPFSPREVTARVKAVLRRTRPSPIEGVKQVYLNYPGFTINPSSRQVMVNGQQIKLTPKEYDLLYYLAQSPNRAFTREELLVAVWGYDYFGDTRTVDTHVNRLRVKLLQASSSNSYIATVWGVGYRFDPKKTTH